MTRSPSGPGPLNLINKHFVLEVQQKLLDLGFDAVNVTALDRVTCHMIVTKGVVETRVEYTQTGTDFMPGVTGSIRIDAPIDPAINGKKLVLYENVDDFAVQLYNFLTDKGLPDFRQFTGLQ